MFRLFNKTFKSYPLAEVKAGKHLSAAEEADFDDYFAKKQFTEESPWGFLFIGVEVIYWGEINDEGKVPHKHFFKTPKADIEREFAIYDEANDFVVMRRLKRYIEANLDEIDGARYELLDAEYESTSILSDNSFSFIIQAHANHTPVVLQPSDTTLKTLSFRVIVDSHDLKLMKIKPS